MNRLLWCILIPCIMVAAMCSYLWFIDWNKKRKEKKKLLMAEMTLEYDLIRSSIALCFFPSQVNPIYARITQFEVKSEKILPKELRKQFIDHLHSLIKNKISVLKQVRWGSEQLLYTN